MKIFLTALLLLIFSTCAFSQSNDTIHWSPCYKLKWEDFKGLPDTNLQYEALTFSGIDYKYFFTDTSFTFTTAAFFDKKKSWKTPSANNGTLKHEQLHFDITEIFTRKLKVELFKLKPKRASVKKVIADLVQKIIQEKENMQDRYDTETDFGRKPDLQKKWQVKVAAMLLIRQKNKRGVFTIANTPLKK
jgi:outer membrane protein W